MSGTKPENSRCGRMRFSIIDTLRSFGHIVKENGAYRLSLRFLVMGGTVRQRQHVYRLGKDEIDALSISRR